MITASDIRKYLAEAAHGLVAALGEPAPAVALTRTPDGRHGLALVRDGYKLQQLDGVTTCRRAHAIDDVDSLAAWLRRNSHAALVEILVDEDKIVAALDPRNPIGDVVSCPLTAHPRAARWLAVLAKMVQQPQLQRLFLTTLDDFERTQDSSGRLLGSYGEELARQLQKFGAVRNAEVDVEIDAMGTVVFAAQTEKITIKGSLPPRFKVNVPIFLGIQLPTGENGDLVEATYELDLFMSVHPQERGAPLFSLSCPNLEVVMRQARADAARWLSYQLGPEFLVGLGKTVLPEVLDFIA
jgi:hypothetical protein